MRALPTLLLAVATSFAVACSNPFADAQKLDTIEAYEAFLTENPTSPFLVQAEIRIEELMLEKAQASQDIADYDALLKRFPEGKGMLYDKVWEERREVLFNTADEVDTVEAWQRYIDEYPSGDKKKKQAARDRLKLAEFLPDFTIAPPELEQINLARDPEGPLNGWEFRCDVTYKGDRPVQYLNMRAYYLDADGNTLDTRDWPVVARHLPGYLPFKEGFDKPMVKGDTRTWTWTTGDMPAGWAKKLKIKPIKIRFLDEYTDDEK